MTYNYLVWVCSGIYKIMRYLHICKGNNLRLKLLFAGSKKADFSLLFCHHRPCHYPWSYGAPVYHCVACLCNVLNFRPTRIFFFDVSGCTFAFALAQGGLYVQCAICKSDSQERPARACPYPVQLNSQESHARCTSALSARLPALLM